MNKPRTRHGRMIRKYRLRAGLSQVQLAKKARLSQSQISKLENGDAKLDLDVAERLCDALDIPRDKLFPLIDASSDVRRLLRDLLTDRATLRTADPDIPGYLSQLTCGSARPLSVRPFLPRTQALV